MNQKKTIILIFLFAILSMLLIVRTTFLIHDSRLYYWDFLVTLLIAIGSMGLIFGIVKIYESELFEWIKNNKHKLLLIGLVFSVEIAFLVKNKLAFTSVYFFSILLIVTVHVIISSLLPRKLGVVYDLVVFTTMILYTFAQDFYYRIFNDLFSFKEFVTIQEGLESGQDTYKFNPFHLLLIIVLTIGLVYYFKLLPKEKAKLGFTKKMGYFSLILLAIIQFNMNYPINTIRRHTSDHYLYYSVYSKRNFVSKFGLSNLIIRDFVDSLIPTYSTKRDIELLDQYFETKNKVHNINEYTNIFANKNLVFVVGESFDELALDPDITPNLLRLKNEGIDFTNHFAPVYPRTTCDSEIIYNTGLIPSIEDGPTCYIYNQNTYRNSLAQLFKNQGYLTQAFHNNHSDFYNRRFLYNQLGYDHFYGQNELGLSKNEIRYDSIFYEKTKSYIKKEDAPFYTFILSLSGHSPYTDFSLAGTAHIEYIKTIYPDAPSTVQYYLATQRELDIMIGLMMEDLDNKGLLDDTVIIFTGDHFPYTLEQKDYEDFTGITDEYLKQRGALYIWSKDLVPQKIDLVSSSFDILPMIINMFGLDGNYNEYMGQDVFGRTEKPLVFFKDYTVYDGVAFIRLDTQQFGEDYLTALLANEYYLISNRILRSNYYSKEEDES
ncbi:MAG: LTA synthase family protein [Acholeplasmataceae bacterium]